jgi:uncharacterized protein (TIGR02391 family)
MAMFTTTYDVPVIRINSEGAELNRVFRVGGDLDRKLLFNPGKDIKRGDIIVVNDDDERRVVIAIRPKRTIDGSIAFYEADLEPESSYRERRLLLEHLHEQRRVADGSAEEERMQRGRSSDPDVPPTIPHLRAVDLLRAAVSKVPELEKLHRDDPEIDKWVSTTTEILHAAFGKPNGNPHQNVSEFEHATGGAVSRRMPDHEQVQWCARQMQIRKAVLESSIQQLEILIPPAAQAHADAYRFHPEIERVSGQLYRDGHYRDAALTGYIRVIEEVKARSGLPLEGEPLMNRVFGCDKQTPVIQVNALSSQAEVDEQKGFMNLFKGLVGLRNLKAHSVVLFNDPHRAHDYLALASLLMRILEISKVNP